MRLAKVLLMSVLILTGCAQLESLFDEDSNQSPVNEVVEDSTKI